MPIKPTTVLHTDSPTSPTPGLTILLSKPTPPPRDHPPRLTSPTVTIKPESCCRRRCLAGNVVVANAGTPETYVEAEMKRFTTNVVSLLKDFNLYASQGGPINLSHIQNEYGNIEKEYGLAAKNYIKWPASMARSLNTGHEEAVQNGSRSSPKWHGIMRLPYRRSTRSNVGVTENELLAKRKWMRNQHESVKIMTPDSCQIQMSYSDQQKEEVIDRKRGIKVRHEIEENVVICLSELSYFLYDAWRRDSVSVMLSHLALVVQSLANIAGVGYSKNDVYMHTALFGHVGGLSPTFHVYPNPKLSQFNQMSFEMKLNTAAMREGKADLYILKTRSR
ncbi:beta-galactosidase 8 [Tanacetum coccineum]